MAVAQVAVFRTSESMSPTTKGHNKMASTAASPSPESGNNANASTLNINNTLTITSPGRTNNPEGIAPLMLACQQGRPEDVQKILKKKSSSAKQVTKSGKVALHFCAESGNSACTTLLLAADPSLINVQDEEGYTPLDLAVINGNKDIVRKLIAAGADLNCLDNESHSLVHWATVCGELEILDILLSNGAAASTPDIHLAHPIHYASQMCGTVNGVGSVSRARVQSTVYGVSPKKGLKLLKRLIQAGCPIDVKDQDGRQPLLWAASAGSGEAILMLVNAGAKVDAEDKEGLTALHCAASRGHTDCLETLIGLCGTEVDVIDNNGCTALFYAVTCGHADCTELLLNYGAEPNRQDRKGRTPAHCGASKGQLETLKLLAKHGGNLWLRNVRGDIPLHEAVLSRRKDLVMWLLSLKQDAANTHNNDGRCPIHLAALNNNVEMVKILIDHHANVNLLMRSGKGAAMTPLDAALHKGNSAVAKFLQLHGGIPSSSLNDVSLQRKLNRSVEGQISPASSMQGSHLGSHHHPSPDEHQRTFISPDVFDHTLGTYSRNDFSKAENHPTIASSTPIMDDGVQTDPRYTKDMEVQVSDSFEEAARKSELSNSHRKSERRRRRKSRSPRQDKNNSSSNSSSPERSSNQLTSTTSRKSSRKSTKDNSAASGSKSKTSEEKSSESIETKNGEIIHEEKPEKKVTTQESSDTMQEDHDNTLRSEKFSELENVAVQSSETDAREEELASDTEVGIKEVEVTETQESINTEKENSVPATEIAEIKESKTKTKELSRERKSKSKTPTQLQRERSASAKSHKTSSLSAERRSRSASAESRSSSAHQNEEIRKKEKCKTGNKKTESENEVVSPPVIQSGKASNVSFNDKKKSSKTSRNRSKSAEDRDRKSRSKSKEGTEKTTRNRSKSATERRKETPKLENVEIKKQSKSRSSSAKKDQKRPKTPKEETTIYDEIEAGKSINLQEAALKRQESLSRDPSRSRSRSISITRHTCESTSTILKSKAPAKSKLKVKNRRVLTTSEEREIKLQEALLGSSKILRHKEAPQHKGFSDNHRGVTTSTSEELRTKLSPQGKQSYVHVKRRVVTRRPGSGHGGRKTIFSSSPKNFRGTKNTNSYDTLIVHQMSVENGGLEDEAYSTSTRGSVTSEEAREQIISPRRKKIIYSRPRSKLTFSRNDNNARASPKPKKIVNVETQISVTQAMQASMRKYNLERMIFHELLELKRLQVRAGKANEQLLIKRLAENYKRAGYSVSFKDFDGPFTFRNFEKYLYDQLRLLQTSRKVLPRFAPSDDIEKLSTALKKMNSAKLPYLDDAERSESVCSNLQCTHTTHRCHHAAHAYTGVPCAAYIGNRKTNNGFLPRVNPLKAPGPLNLSSPMNISISPRTDTQSPITLEVQQGSNTQVFTLPTKTLDPSKNYYVSLSIKPNPTSPIPSPVPSSDNPTSRPPPMNDVVDDGSISAPPPPVDSGSDVQVDNMDRDKHNRSM